ncbi:HAMP domain-containing protein [Ectothiorhodospiraceae bacterium BW-2]|nr:HAMP domain-containing protein [Ectothiorhodospiraceae bacterium BW-2]
MRVQTKFQLPIILALLIGTVVIVLVLSAIIESLNNQQSETVDELITSGYQRADEKRMNEIYGKIDHIAQKALGEVAFFSQMPEVLSAYRLAHQGNMDDENDPTVQRARLQLREAMRLLAEGWRAATGLEELRLHFHLPTGRSFVRTWRDGWQTVREGNRVDISDDLTSFRSTVVAVNRDKRPLIGIEVGRGGFVIRGITPITDNDGTHLGSTEIYYSFSPVVEEGHQSNPLTEFAVYMDSALLPVAKQLQDQTRYPRLDDRFVLTAATRAEVTTPLVSSALLDRGREQPYSQMMGSRYVTIFPVTDFIGEKIGVIVMATDIGEQQQTLKRIRAMGDEALANIQLKLVIALLVIMTLIGVAAWLTTRRVILQPLVHAVELADAVAEGDLTCEIIPHSNDELGELLTAMGRMRASLMGMIHTLSDASDNISTASTEIANGNEDLSQRTNDLAANIEKIASSLEELTSTVSHNEQRVRDAEQQVSETLTKARHGGEVATKTLTSMDEISAASKQVTAIIEVIDSIAFQTNLLALNAAVEAARAGDHGRGFAVVATEVRMLAQRSADSAKEITDLINNTLTKVDEGSHWVHSTSHALQEIEGAVGRVSAYMSEINSASREQSIGISQVNGAIAQMESMTQQNAALVEQVSAASQAMADEAAKLTELITRFTLLRADG